MKILFPDNLLNPREVDPDFAEEYEAARQAGFTPELVSLETLNREGDANRAIRRVVPGQEGGEPILYRGWMLKSTAYEKLFEALATKNQALLTSPAAYRHAHHLPEAYPLLVPHAPATVWQTLSGPPDFTSIMELLQPFGGKPVLLKDYVKSQKHYWHEACFIPNSSDTEAVQQVVNRFLELQGDDLNEGLVFREYRPLMPLAQPSRSGLPQPEEYRLFFLHHRLLAVYPYWEEGKYEQAFPASEWATQVAAPIQSPFFSMDVARTQAGEWIVIELGDGQVSGLPEAADITDFYQKLHWELMPSI